MGSNPCHWKISTRRARVKTFEKFGVPQGERDELVAIVNSTKGDIVAGSP